MKQILSILLIIYSFSSFAQKFDEEKDYYKKVDNRIININNCNKFIVDTIKDGDNTIIGFYDYLVHRIIVKSKTYSRSYYFWGDTLFYVFDTKIKKKIYVTGKYKNIKQKLAEYFILEANNYKKLFTTINLNIPLTFHHLSLYYFYDDNNIFDKLVCLFNENSKYKLSHFEVTCYWAAFDETIKAKNCHITKNMKNTMNRFRTIIENITITDKILNKEYILPTIMIKKHKKSIKSASK